MDKKIRAIIKVGYYFIGIVLVCYVTSDFDLIWIVAFSSWILFGAIMSWYLKLPLFTEINLYRVDQKHFDGWDIFMNVLFVAVAIGLTIMIFCQQLATPKTPLVDSQNNLMTAELFNQLVEIDYWEGNEKIVISQKEDITKIYNIFASLKLSEGEANIENLKYGHILLDFVTKDEKVGIGILSDEIVVNGEKYRVNKDILEEVREIVFE